ncbi:hypothetical protein FYL99_RS20355 [Escherichia coli]|nr:hypothetical protein [Escherichia coli]
MTELICFLLLGLVALQAFWLRQRRKETDALNDENSALRFQQKIIGEIMRCPKYGLASQYRRIRVFNAALLIAPSPPPHITRLEQDIKLEVMLGKISSWAVSNRLIGRDDIALTSRYRPDIYDTLARESDEFDELSSDIAMIFRLHDDVHRRNTVNEIRNQSHG